MKFLPDRIDQKTAWIYFISLPVGIVIYFILFLLDYILKPQIEQTLLIILISLLDGLIIWFALKGLGAIPRIVVIIPILVIGFLISIIYLEMVHEYVMWKTCYPAIEKKLGGQTGTTGDPLSRDGSYKSWLQHIECEDNLLPFPWGKEAKFSDNPPGFIPKETSQEKISQ